MEYIELTDILPQPVMVNTLKLSNTNAWVNAVIKMQLKMLNIQEQHNI